MTTAAAHAALPLAGIRVLDLTRLLPGPMCTFYFVQLGAEVIKVEDTGAGDYARSLGAPPGEVGTFFSAINAGKRSIALDLKAPRGREAFLALARTADMIVEGFRPGVVAALGIGEAAVRALNPRVVYVSITGYGQDGPRAAAAGHDINYLGYAGVLDQIGVRDGAPALSNLQIADLLGGAAMPAVAALAALLDAQRTGRGRAVDVAMADAVLAHNVLPLQTLAQQGRVQPRGTDMLTGGLPCYGVYRTQDGRHLAVGALEDKFWRVLVATLGRPDLADSRAAQGAEGERVRKELARIFASAPLAHWRERLEPLDACVGPVATLDEALADPQFVARGMVARAPDGSPRFGAPFRMTGVPASVAAAAPHQGEHGRAVLREAGLDEATIDALARDGVLRCDAGPSPRG